MNVGLEAEGTSDSKLITATGLCQAGPVEGAAGLSGVAGAQSHSEHVTQVLVVKDEARRAPLSPSLPKSEN